MNPVRNILAVSTVLLALCVASSALALTDTYVDFLGVSDLGFVASGEVFAYEHHFDPEPDRILLSDPIDNVWLSIGAVSRTGNEWTFMGEEELDLGTTTWGFGCLEFEIFQGEVRAQIDLAGLVEHGVVTINVDTDRDGILLWSKMVTQYQYGLDSTGGGGAGPGGVNAIPEPSAALVFAFGALIVTRSARRGRR